jgi:hypothetical protein
MNAKTANALIAKTNTMNFEDLHDLAAELSVPRETRDRFQRMYARKNSDGVLKTYRLVIGSAIVANSHND